MRDPHASRGIRWWPAPVIVIAAIAAVWRIWLSAGDETRQERLFSSVPIVLAAIVLLAIWLIFFSRASRRARVATGAIAVGLVVLTAATVRVGGVTGDLIPILEWRWSRPQAALATLPSPPPPDPGAVSSAAPAAVSGSASTTPAAAPAVPAAAREPSRPDVPAGTPPAAAGEYPQYLGADRNGVVRGAGLATDWKTSPPRVVWRRSVGAAWSGFAVADGLAVTQEQRGDQEMVVAYSLADGSPRWAHGDRAHFESTVAGEGPRATPTISRGRVFTLGSTGLLNALDLRTGRSIWRRDIAADNQSPQPDWGRSSSPLAVDDLVVVSAGGPNGHSLVAYRRDTGEPAWHGGSDRPSYSSPQLATLAGVRQILILNQDTIASHDPSTGRLLWEHAWPRQQPSVAQPLLLDGDRVLFSAGYGIGSRLLQVASSESGAPQATLLWESPRLKAKFTNLVSHRGYVYGLDDGVLVSLDPATGERTWKSGRYGHGQVILADDLLLVQTEEGELVLVQPRPDEHRELTRFTVFSRKTWNPPALAGRLLLVRNDVEAVCLVLEGKR